MVPPSVIVTGTQPEDFARSNMPLYDTFCAKNASHFTANVAGLLDARIHHIVPNAMTAHTHPAYRMTLMVLRLRHRLLRIGPLALKQIGTFLWGFEAKFRDSPSKKHHRKSPDTKPCTDVLRHHVDDNDEVDQVAAEEVD